MPYSTNVSDYEETAPEVSSASLRDHPMPQNIAAEQAVLAAMILDPDILEEAILTVKKEAFYRPSHQIIYQAIVEMNAVGTPVDQISLAEKLDAMGELQHIGGKSYILELANNSFALANWRYHAEIVNRQYLLRRLIYASTKISAMCYDAPDNTEEVVEEAEKLVFDVTDKEVKSTFHNLGDLMGETITMLDELAQRKTHIMGVSTGFKAIDEILAGMRGGDLIVVAARPGIGKTSFALNVAVNAAKEGTSVAFFSLEMPADQLIQKIMCTEARVDLKKMRTGNLSQADWQQIIRSCSSLGSLDFAIDDSSALSVMELRAKARRQLHGKEKGLIVVDYLQLMESHTGYKDRHLEVAEFSRGLKMLAKDLDVPIIALSQLSRRVDDREGKRPQLSDLRESGSIEQDADVVIFIDRSMNDEEAENPKRPDKGVARIIVEKHRNGPTGVAELAFNPAFTRFDDLYRAPDEYAEDE